MLPEYQQHYQQFVQLLEQLQASSQAQDLQQLRSCHQKAQQFFREQLLTLEPVNNYHRSYQTEIAKELQLIGMDVRFLQAARVPETSANRQKQLLDRLSTLLKYCTAILQLTKKL